jgi:uncharacterized protein YigA (DUF484 family)
METKVLNEHEVAAYLQQNPEFFENHADLLAVMHVPSAHGKGAVSLAERQQVAQRDKIRQLERKYSELLTIGIENDETGNKVHQLTLGLLNSVNFLALNQMLVETLRENFNVPYVNIKLWASPADNDLNKQAAFELVDESLKTWVLGLDSPYCGSPINDSFEYLLNDGVGAKSYAVIPLGATDTIGFLVLASDDEKRFYPGMGTLFLQRLNELLTAALSRYVS